MEENTNDVVQETTTEQSKPTFDELLKDPEYQAEFDRKAEGMKKKWHESWQKKAEKERSEAEALAKMTEDEKHQHEVQKLQSRINELETANNARELHEATNKRADEKGVDRRWTDLFNFETETAESIDAKLDMIAELRNKDREAWMNEAFKQPRPQEVRGSHISSEKQFLDEKYKDNPYYKK